MAAPANLLYRGLNPDLNGDVLPGGKAGGLPPPPAGGRSGGRPVSKTGGGVRRKKTWLELINPIVGGLNSQQDGGTACLKSKKECFIPE